MSWWTGLTRPRPIPPCRSPPVSTPTRPAPLPPSPTPTRVRLTPPTATRLTAPPRRSGPTRLRLSPPGRTPPMPTTPTPLPRRPRIPTPPAPLSPCSTPTRRRPPPTRPPPPTPHPRSPFHPCCPRPRRAPHPHAPPRLAQLPPPPAHFTGRADTHRALYKTLAPLSIDPNSHPQPHPLAVITGMAGCRQKRPRVVHGAHAEGSFPRRAVVREPARRDPGMTPLTSGQALHALLRDLGPSPVTFPNTRTRQPRCSAPCSPRPAR